MDLPRLPLAQQPQVEVAMACEHLSGHSCNAVRAGAVPTARGGLCCAVEVAQHVALVPELEGPSLPRPPSAGTLAGCCPAQPPCQHPLSLGLSRRFVPCQGCGAALRSCLGAGNGAAVPAWAISWGPEPPWLCPWDFCGLVCSLGVFFLVENRSGTG